MKNSLQRIVFIVGLIMVMLTQRLSVSAQHLVRGPYLTRATQHSITISWNTDIACNSKINIGLQPGNYTGGIVNNSPTTYHVITLPLLNPDTKYYYSIGTTSLILQGDSENYFRTLPMSNAHYDKPVRIWAVGDIAKNTPNEALVRDMFLHYIDTQYVDAYLMLGDNAYPSGLDSNFQIGFFDYFQPKLTRHTVLWPAIGNHEYDNNYSLRKSHQVPYFDIFTLPVNGECGGVPSHTEMYYSFDIGNVHFVNLDSYGLEIENGQEYGLADTAGSPQIEWLKQDLDANGLPWVIVSFHHPPYCLGTHNSDIEPDLIAIREHLNPILERYNVDLVLNGHDHTYQRSQFIHQHYGYENSFDSINQRVQTGSGGYVHNDCPYIKNSIPPQASDSGLIYAVIGCGSDYHYAPQTNWPHDAMYYSNAVDNGSMYINVEGNKLEAVFLSTDSLQPIKDRFTIYKQVNRTQTLSYHAGDTLTLTASWASDWPYQWSTGDTSRTIHISPQYDQWVIVQDANLCLRDSFWLRLTAPNLTNNPNFPSLIVSPNPTSNELEIRGLPEGLNTLYWYNSLGQCIKTTSSNAREPVLHVDLRSFPTGTYFLSIMRQTDVLGRFSIQVGVH